MGVHTPWQLYPSGQTTPHAPQLELSKLRLVQTPPQSVPPGSHGLHSPPLQYGVDPPQTLPQAPQFSGSLFTGVQVPLQRMAPARIRRRTCLRRTRRFRWEEVRHRPLRSFRSCRRRWRDRHNDRCNKSNPRRGSSSRRPRIRVVQQVAAHPAAGGGRARRNCRRTTNAAGVAVARPTGRQAL